MRNLIKNKRAGFTDLFLFLILAFTIILISGVFIFMGNEVETKLHEKMDNMSIGSEDQNVTQIIDETIGQTNESYNALYWISIFLIVGMIIGIFIGSYMVKTKPIFFIPYLFIVIIAIIVAVAISNAYETIIANETLAPTFAGFVGANWIMAFLPMWIAVIGMVGGIIMFSRMGRKEEQQYYGY